MGCNCKNKVKPGRRRQAQESAEIRKQKEEKILELRKGIREQLLNFRRLSR